MHRRRWRRREVCFVDQVGNGPDTGVDLTPASDAPAEAVRAAWLPLLPGQDVPLVGERVYEDDDSCIDE